jgi:pyruvate dehydrogenase E2 component (dihydrolipoamide acetyltransferase)
VLRQRRTRLIYFSLSYIKFQPIAVLVDDADDVAAFEDFVADDAGAAPKEEAAAPAEEKKEESSASKADAPKAEAKSGSSDGNTSWICAVDT